ncbi:hypothetical protein A8L45_03205 [Veronia pacifica]|uniref:N-acetyltransferase domain-containing protein n=1 Tax=Veronia pacifica TaxID=1080227 RepID=A0A1C3ER53_9GAMM|nr:hypothetical protein A8L45_03205 [Veronia pacifica]
MHVQEAKTTDLAVFFEYLGQLIKENAAHDAITFQPQNSEQTTVSEELKHRFIEGLDTQYGHDEWRRLWLIKSENNDILAHLDLRAHGGEYLHHRVLLGMGVAQAYRRRGFADKLIEKVLSFCRHSDAIDWVDLAVMEGNEKALALYQKHGFVITERLDDVYRIDGVKYGETRMTIKVAEGK